MEGTSTYRLLRGRKLINGVWYEAGDIVTLTEEQALNLRLSITPVGEADETTEFRTTLAEDTDLSDDGEYLRGYDEADDFDDDLDDFDDFDDEE